MFRRLVLGLVCCLPLFAHADTRRYFGVPIDPNAIALTTTASVQQTSNAASITIAGYDPLCSTACITLVSLHRFGAGGAPDCTYGGVTMPRQLWNREGNAGLSIFYRVGTTTSGDIVCTWTTAIPSQILAHTYRNVNQGAPLADSNNVRAPAQTSVSITFLGTSADDHIFDALTIDTNQSASATPLETGQTAIFLEVLPTDRLTNITSQFPAGGSQTPGWSWTVANDIMYWAAVLNRN